MFSLDAASRRSSQGRQSRKGRGCSAVSVAFSAALPVCCCLLSDRRSDPVNDALLCWPLSALLSRVTLSRLLCAALFCCPLCAISGAASYETRRSDVSGALADGVGRVGASALLAGAHVGRGSCCALRWTVLAWAGPKWCNEIR